MIPRVISKTTDLSKIQKVDTLEGPLYQLEESGHTFEITCLTDETLTGTVSARFLRADETTVFFEGTLTDNVASITLPQSCYTSNGRFGMVVFITGSDVTTAIYAVSGSVYRSTSDTVVDPAGVVPSLEELIAQIEACEQATEEAEAAAEVIEGFIAAEYANPYPGYNYFAESQTGYWESKTPSGGSVSSDTISAGTSYKGVRISVAPGEKYEIRAKLNTLPNSGMLWAVQTSGRVTIFRSDSSSKDTTATPSVVKIPENGAYLLVNNETAECSDPYVVRTDGRDKALGASICATNRLYAKTLSKIDAGQLFIANNRLYRATTEIAAAASETATGGNIVPGSNATETTIVDELNAAPVTVSGTTPSITALPGVRYICGEVSTITIVPPASGCVDVVFTSGSTAAVLTVTPPTGMTMHWANGFDPTSLSAETVYEINILDGCLGVAAAWT